jgi:predicted transposase YbfD/YdcC
VRVEEKNRGRIEIRELELIEVTPSQIAFPGAQLAARLQTRVRRKEKWSDEVVYLLSSRSSAQLQEEGMLRLKRGYWVIESRLHHCLDLTLQEDLSRVRNPNAARVLGTIRRVILSLSNAALDRLRKTKPKTKANTKTYRQRFLSALRGRHRLHSLLFCKSPNIWSFEN